MATTWRGRVYEVVKQAPGATSTKWRQFLNAWFMLIAIPYSPIRRATASFHKWCIVGKRGDDPLLAARVEGIRASRSTMWPLSLVPTCLHWPLRSPAVCGNCYDHPGCNARVSGRLGQKTARSSRGYPSSLTVDLGPAISRNGMKEYHLTYPPHH